MTTTKRSINDKSKTTNGGTTTTNNDNNNNNNNNNNNTKILDKALNTKRCFLTQDFLQTRCSLVRLREGQI